MGRSKALVSMPFVALLPFLPELAAAPAFVGMFHVKHLYGFMEVEALCAREAR